MSIDSQTEQPGGYRQVIRSGVHSFITDQPPPDSLGSAPSAHDYFDASLAACKSLTAMWYAKHHNLALERVEVHIERDHSRERQGTYLLKVRLAFFGALSEDEKRKVHAVVERCPVHKLMTTTTIEIETAPFGS